MSGKKRHLLFAVLGTFILLSVLVVYFSKKYPEKTPPAATETIQLETPAPLDVPVDSPAVTPQLITYEAANSWAKVIAGFSTDTAEPQVIYISPDKLLYVQDNQLYRLNFGQQPVSLRQWESPRLAKIWNLGEGFLIGSKEGETAEWQYVRPLKSAAAYFEYSLLRGIASGPEQVIEIKYSADPELAILTFDEITSENTSYPNEYILTPRNFQFESLRLVLNPKQGQEGEKVYYSQKLLRQKEIIAIQPTSKLAENVYTFEDSRGTILYSRDGEVPAFRYGNLKVIDRKTFQYEGFPDEEYIHLKDAQNKEYLAGNGGRFYPFVAAIWQGEWKQLQINIFYQLGEKLLKTVRFESDRSYTSFTAISNEYKLEGLQLIENADKWLTFNKNGKQLYLSLEDVSLQNSSSSKIDLTIESLLMTELPQLQTTKGEVDFPGNGSEPKLTVELPEITQDRSISNKQIPLEVNKVVEERFYSGSGDANVSSLYRKIGDEWYILVDSDLYLFQKNKLDLVGNVPVKVMTRMTNYSVSYGAEDFIKFKDYWYFVDSIGNRLIKLDSKLKLIKELALPAPSAIQILDNGHLEVTSLQGKTEINSQLAVIKISKNKAMLIPDNQIVMAEVSNNAIQPNSYYVDPLTKLTWYYGDPFLNLYQSETKQLRSLYAGTLNNGYGTVRILPYHDQIMLLFDNRVLFFKRDGTYLKVIEFPRGDQPAIYDMTTQGENSLYYAEKQDKLYLVQGFRILTIDLLSDNVTTLFEQNYSNLRKIVYDQGKLYFALQTSIEQKFNNYSAKPKEIYTEICIIELASNQLKRYRMAGDWTVDEIEKDQLVLIDSEPGKDTIKSFYYSLDNIY